MRGTIEIAAEGMTGACERGGGVALLEGMETARNSFGPPWQDSEANAQKHANA